MNLSYITVYRDQRDDKIFGFAVIDGYNLRITCANLQMD